MSKQVKSTTKKSIPVRKQPAETDSFTKQKTIKKPAKKSKLIAKITAATLCVATIITITALVATKLLPLKFLLPLIIAPAIIAAAITFAAFVKTKSIRTNVILSAISIVLILAHAVASFYLFNTLSLINLFNKSSDDSVAVERVRDITKDPFILYISGHDAERQRSDVNQLIIVNPKTHTILIHNTPRDYGVYLHDKPQQYDKLTHAGIYGTETSVKTMEDLYGIKINYYLQIEFETVVKLVDTIGGIDVNSPYDFPADGYNFKLGINHLDGKQTLAFSRDRKHQQKGDDQRGENQQLVIDAILKKLASPTVITNYASIITALDGTFSTNITGNEISDFIRFQLEEQPAWSIQHSVVTGFATWDFSTFTYPDLKLYITLPDQKSITAATAKIQETLKK